MSPANAPSDPVSPATSPSPAANDPLDPVTAALARLESSRAGLRQIMIPPKRAPRRAAGSAAGATGGEAPGFSRWLPERWQDALDDAAAWLRRHPVSALLVDGVQGWWRQHPLRHVAAVAGEEVSAVASPLIRRHPVAAVGLAAAAGALVVVGRPWRWRVLGGSERPLSRRMMRWVSSQIPLQAALGALMALVLDQARQAAAQAAAGENAAAPSSTAAQKTPAEPQAPAGASRAPPPTAAATGTAPEKMATVSAAPSL